MPFDPTVHHSVKTRDGSQPGKVTPYMIVSGLEGQVYIQDGKFLTPGGEVIPDDEVPEWAWNIAVAMNDETRASLGMEGLPPNEKTGAAKRAPREQVDIEAGSKGNPAMQLGEDEFEHDGKATPVPQDQETKTGKPPAQQAAKAPIAPARK